MKNIKTTIESSKKEGYKWTEKIHIYDFREGVATEKYTNLDGWCKLISDGSKPIDLLNGETFDPTEINAVIAMMEDMAEDYSVAMTDIYIDWIIPETM